MASGITPGQWVNVKITKEPRAIAQRKTLVRLFEKDSQVKAERSRQKRTRPVRQHRRGGRLWSDRPPRLALVKTCAGASYRIFASVDVIKDLESLGSHVQVTPA